MRYIHRVAESTVKRFLNAFPVVGISGPRQSGKSTLLQHLLKDYRYVSFDDLRMVDLFAHDPVDFMQQYSNHVIFDEVQFVPKIFHEIKLAVDKDRHNYGKFVLTGSSQFMFMQKVAESLAGRIGLLSLLPFQWQEVPKHLRKRSIYQGSYPELIDRDYADADLWYSSYFDTYLNKDVRTLSKIGDMSDFRRLIRLLAGNTAQILDQSYYAKVLGVSVPTIKRWLSILEASYIIFLLPPFYENFGKRIVKRPKVYFYDIGIISYLVGIQTQEHYEKGPMAGSIYENYLISEILKKHIHQKSTAELFYMRTSSGEEIDLIVDYKQHKEFIEIKKNSTFKPKMLDTIKNYMGPDDQGFLLYNGDDFPIRKNLNVMNYEHYLESPLKNLM